MSLLRPALYALGALASYLALRRVFFKVPHLTCSTEFTAKMHGGTRALSRIGLIVLHSTSPPIPPGATKATWKGVPTARSTAQYFAATTNNASTHYVIDDTSCYQTLPENVVPYGSGGGRGPQGQPNETNQRGVHIEAAGYDWWTRAQWMEHEPMLAKIGYKMAELAERYGIPLAMLGPQATRDGIAKGVTLHKTVSDAFPGGSGHQDPGPGFPIDVLLRYARGG